MGKKQGRETRKRKKSPGKENGGAARKTYSAQTKQFPGCHKRPKVSGTADLSVSYVYSSDDEIILDSSNKNSKMRNMEKIQVTSSCNSGENCRSVQVSESNNYSSTSSKKRESSCSEVRVDTNVIPDDAPQFLPSSVAKDEASEKIQRPKCNNQYAKEAGGHLQKGNLRSQPKEKKRSANADTSSVVPHNLAAAGASTSAEREQGQLQDDAFALLLHVSADTGAAVVAEQRRLEARLRQEAEDAKLARRLQRHLATVTVDRTQGSGEEYQLRPRRRRCSPAPAPEAGAARGASPCY